MIEKLQADKKTRDIPVIVLTMKDLTKREMQNLCNHASAVMRKTAFKREEFVTEVKRFASLCETKSR